MFDKNPENVEYVYSQNEMEEKMRNFLHKKFGKVIKISIQIDQTYDDLFDIVLKEDDIENDAATLDLLNASGFPPDDMDTFKDKLFNEMVDVKGFTLMAYLTGWHDTELNILIKFPFATFQKKLQQA